MNWLSLLGIAIGLAMDAFAVSLGAGLTLGGVTGRHVFRLAFHFGLFQFLMPILGWLIGSTVLPHVARFGHYAAFGLLTFIGGKMLYDAWRGTERKAKADPTRGWSLVALSVATSLDALAVGLSMAFLQVPIVLPCIVIGLVAALFSAIGITFGHRVRHRWGRVAEVVGAVTLLLVGLRILISPSSALA